MEVDKLRKRKGFFKTLVTILLGTRKEYKVEDLGIFLRGSIQNVAWTKCRTKYVKPLVHR